MCWMQSLCYYQLSTCSSKKGKSKCGFKNVWSSWVIKFVTFIKSLITEWSLESPGRGQLWWSVTYYPGHHLSLSSWLRTLGWGSCPRLPDYHLLCDVRMWPNLFLLFWEWRHNLLYKPSYFGVRERNLICTGGWVPNPSVLVCGTELLMMGDNSRKKLTSMQNCHRNQRR